MSVGIVSVTEAGLNAVRNACCCRDDQLLQIVAADLGGMVVLINGHGLRAKPEGDLPVAEDCIIRKDFSARSGI